MSKVEWVGGWVHEDESVCNLYLAPVSSERLWCTDHQMYVTHPESRT